MTRFPALPAALLLLAAACAADREPGGAAKTDAPPPARTVPAPPAAPAPGTGPGSEVEGRWRVVARQAPGISAMTETESEAMVGREAEYGASAARVGTDTCQVASYRRETVSAADFEKAFRVTPGALGLGDPVTLVRVHCGGAEWSNPGAMLIVAGPGRLWTVWDGVFFRMERPG